MKNNSKKHRFKRLNFDVTLVSFFQEKCPNIALELYQIFEIYLVHFQPMKGKIICPKKAYKFI